MSSPEKPADSNNWETALRQEKIEGRGRGMVAARDLQAGEILLRESPLLVYQEAEAAENKTFCAHCMRVLMSQPTTTLCPSCSSATFCSPDCMDAAQSTSHTSRVCKAIASLEKKGVGFSVESKTLVRFLIAAYNLSFEDPKAFEKLLELEGQESKSSSVQELKELHEFLVEAFDSLNDDASARVLMMSMDMTKGLLARDACNTFGLMSPFSDGERRVRGYAIYARASMFNHDCLPNACRFEYIDRCGEKNNTDVYIRALHAVEEGTEICLSYFPVDWPYGDRQKKLEEEYGFNCKCQRCQVEAQWKDDEDDEEAEEDDDNVEGDEDDDVEACAGKKDLKKSEEDDDSDDDDDFGHAMFFVKYLCPADECGGTMAPYPPGKLDEQGLEGSMECNFCGRVRSDEEFHRDLEEHDLQDD